MEAEQKFGGYSFCHLGRDKGRKAKKQKRNFTTVSGDQHARSYERVILEAEQKSGVILSVTWAEIKEEKQRSRKGGKDWGE